MMSNDFNNQQGNYNYYGLSASFLESLGITGPLHNKVFVANVSIYLKKWNRLIDSLFELY